MIFSVIVTVRSIILMMILFSSFVIFIKHHIIPLNMDLFLVSTVSHIIHLTMLQTDNSNVHFEVDDLLPSEIVRRTVGDAESEWSSPALRVIMPGRCSSSGQSSRLNIV